MNEAQTESPADKSKTLRPAEWTGIPSAPRLVSVRSFCRSMDINRATAWRMERDGKLPKPVYLGRRAYYPAEAIEEFETRARRGEFATVLRPIPRPRRTR